MASSRRGMDRARSMRTGDTSVPNADSTLALTGKMTRCASSSSATPQAWTGPAPPKASNDTPRRSTPCSTACIRAAAAMFWLTISWMPAATSTAPRPSDGTDRSRCGDGGRGVERHVTAEEDVAGRCRPSTTSASVTAGSVPPRP